MRDLIFGLSLIGSSIPGMLVFISIFKRRESSTESKWLMFAVASAVMWTGVYAPRHLLPEQYEELIYFFDSLIYVPVMLCSWFMFLFVYRTLEAKTLPKILARIIIILAVANTIAILSNPFTQVMVNQAGISEQAGFRVVDDSYGPWFIFHCVFSYIPGMASIYYLLKHLVKLRGRHRVMVSFLLFGLCLTIASTLFAVLDLLPWPIDTSPLTVQIALFLFYYSVFHIKSLSTVAIARIALFENADSILFIINESGVIEDLNNKAKKLAQQLELEELRGVLVDDFISRWHDVAHGSYYETNKTIFSVIENGEKTHYQVSRYHIMDKSGRQQGYYAEITNIEHIMKLTFMLNEANEANRAKSEFVSRMSHEIRTPMHAIIGMTQIGLEAPDDAEKMIYCFNNIDRASKHLMSLLNNILDLSKIEANKLDIINDAFDFLQLFEDVNSIIKIQADEKNHTLEFTVEPNVPRYLISDKLRLSQVLMNILTNAIKFTPDYGTISVNVSLVSNISDKESLIKISVKDDGIGINTSQQSKIFESFEQADGTTSRRFGGTGLGLAIAKSIIEIMGGSIDVVSEPREGSCFSIFLKAEHCEQAEYEKTHTHVQVQATYSKCNLLLVEDIEINREIVIALLGSSKINIDCAENGVQAVEAFKGNPDKYDIILMDIHMPVMDGFEATKLIRNSGAEASKTIPIIALTANAFKEDAHSCFKAGMNDHLGKPIDADKMYGILEKYLTHKADG